jgi:hypothetical protein
MITRKPGDDPLLTFQQTPQVAGMPVLTGSRNVLLVAQPVDAVGDGVAGVPADGGDSGLVVGVPGPDDLVGAAGDEHVAGGAERRGRHGGIGGFQGFSTAARVGCSGSEVSQSHVVPSMTAAASRPALGVEGEGVDPPGRRRRDRAGVLRLTAPSGG